MKASKEDEDVWDALLEKATEIAALYDIDPSIPRRAKRQRHRANVEVDTPSAHWKRAVYLPFLGRLISEVNELLVKPLYFTLPTIIDKSPWDTDVTL